MQDADRQQRVSIVVAVSIDSLDSGYWIHQIWGLTLPPPPGEVSGRSNQTIWGEHMATILEYLSTSKHMAIVPEYFLTHNHNP